MRVLIAVDESDFAKLICDFVTHHQWPEDTEFTVLNVAEPLKVGSVMALLPGPLLDEMVVSNANRAKTVVASTAKAIASTFKSLRVSEKTTEGVAKEAIVDFANSWKADLIVIGCHNRKMLGKLFLGSVSLAVASNANCSVMIVKPTESAECDNQSSDSQLVENALT